MDKVLLPVPPEKLTIKVKGGNKTYVMMNGGQVNALKSPELMEISFDMFLPNHVYPFAVYFGDFQPSEYYLEKLRQLKEKKKVFQFIVSRVQGSTLLFDTNIKCTLEDYTIVEDAEKYGTDVMVSVSLKQYRDYGVKKCRVKTKKKLSLKKLRDSKMFHLDSDFFIICESVGERIDLKTGKKIKEKNVTTDVELQKTVTLYNLAKKIYGKGSLYTLLADANPVSMLSCAKNASPEAVETVHYLKYNKKKKMKKSQKLYRGMYLTIPLEYWS